MTVPILDPGLTFFFIRHGETAWNKDGRLQGQRNLPLNPLGRDQASAAGRALGQILRKRGIADPRSLRFVASPLDRAQETMRLARVALRLAPDGYEIDDRLRELTFGQWEGLTWAEVKGRAPEAFRARRGDKWGFVPPGGESYAMLGERLRPWLGSIRNLDVVVAHGGVARVLFHLIGGCDANLAPALDIWQGRVLTFEAGRFHWN